MTRSLLFVSLLVWGLCCSCVSLHPGYRPVGEKKMDGQEWTGMIDKWVGINKYNLQIDAGRKHFSGLLLVKQMQTGHFRMVFTTHFGMRVFDFGFSGDSLKVYYCISPLNREKIFRFFHNDFAPLFGRTNVPGPKVKVCRNKKDQGMEIWHYPGNLCYWRQNGQVVQITAGRGWGKTTWLLEDYRSGFPSVVSIRHAFWPVRLKLERL